MCGSDRNQRGPSPFHEPLKGVAVCESLATAGATTKEPAFDLEQRFHFDLPVPHVPARMLEPPSTIAHDEAGDCSEECFGLSLAPEHIFFDGVRFAGAIPVRVISRIGNTDCRESCRCCYESYSRPIA